MTRNSLNLTELFENDNSRGSLLVELFQRRQGRIPKVNVFVTPQGNNCSFDIQLDRLSTVESTEQQRVPLYGHRNQNNPVIPSSTETIMNDNENDLEFVEQQSEALIAKPSNNHRRKLPCIKLPVCHGNGDTFKKMSLNDRVRRNNFRNSNSSRKSLMEDVNNLERTKRSIEFNPVICSTPYHKVLPSPKLRSQSNRKSNISNEHDVKQIADELENVLKTLAQDKTNHSQNDPTKAGVSHAISDIGVAKEYESNISNGPNVHNVKQIVDELENALKTVTPDKTNHSQKRSSAKVTIRSAKKRVAREYDLEQASSTSSMKAHENQQQDIEDNGKGENEVEDGNDKIVENFEDKPKILSVEVIRSPFKNNSNKNTTSQDTLNEKKEKSVQDGQRNRNKKKQAFVMKPLENSQVPLDLGNANVNARKTRNSSNIEPLALQKLHKTDNTQTYEHHRKIRQLALNEAPGKPLNGEIYAKELTRSTYNKVLDLRKRTSVGKIFKVKNENEPPSWRTRQSKKKQLEQQELEQQINLKSLERDLLSDKSQQQLQQESQQQLQQLQQQSQRVTELELESQSQSMAIQEPPVEAQLEAHPEHAEHNMSILLDSDACYNECLASPKTLGNKTTETQRKRSIVKKTPNRKSNMKARNSKENMSSVLQNYMELPKRIEQRKSNAQQSKRSLYKDRSLDDSELESRLIKEKDSNLEEHLLNKSVRKSNCNDAELSDNINEIEPPIIQLVVPPSPYKDSHKEMNMSSTSSQVLHKVEFSSTKNSQLPEGVENGNNDVFKKPVGLPPKKGRSRKQEKAKIVENNCSIELRRSNRRVTPNKCFQFVQQLYQQVEERRRRMKSSVIRSSLRSMTPSFEPRSMSGITPNTTQKSTILPPIEEEEKNDLITPGNERNNEVTLKRCFRKVAIKTKENKDSTNEKHESKGNWKVRSCKQTTNSNINEAMHISKCSKNMETPAAPVLPVNSNMKSRNNSRNLKRARKNDFTRNSEEIDESPETHISKKTYASKLSKKAETLSSSSSPIPSSSSSPLAPLPLQSPYTNKQSNMHTKKELKKGHRKEKTMKQTKTSLAKKSTMDKEIPERNDNEEIATPIVSKQVKDNFKISQKKTNLKSTAITESSESVIHATPNKILKSSNNTDQVISSTRKELNEQLTKEENVTKQKRRPPKLHFEKPSQKIKITRATAINENVDIDIKEQQWQIQQTNQLHELSMPENDDLNYSHIALPDPTPVHHLNNMFDSFCGTPSLPKALTTTTSNCLNSTSIIPTRCRNVKVRIKKLPNLPENFTPNILATGNSGNDNCPLQHQAQQVMSSSQQNSELITWLKTVQDIEIFRSSREVFEEMRISSHTNLYFTTLQGIEYAFYNTDDAATLGYLRFKARQIKTRRRAKFYYLHFITITGTFCFTANNRKKILTPGDMVAIQKMVHYEIENLTDDIGILMVIKK